MKTARLTRNATTTRSMWSGLTLKSTANFGSATLTMVMSMIAMNMARTKTTLTEILGFRRSASTTRNNSTATRGIPSPQYSPARRRLVTAVVAAIAIVASLAASPDFSQAPASAATTPAARNAGNSLCKPVTPTSHPRAVKRLRIGVDPGMAGNPIPSTEATKPVNRAKELRALIALRPTHRVLVVRLNRLFWSGGNRLLHHFQREAQHYAAHGFKVEVQVRYHPTKAENGDITAWTHWVRHVVNVLGRNRRLVALTITNEVNFNVSANTSDGSFAHAKDALIRGIEAGSAQLHRHGWARRVSLGFTFAYRLNPAADAGPVHLPQHPRRAEVPSGAWVRRSR